MLKSVFYLLKLWLGRIGLMYDVIRGLKHQVYKTVSNHTVHSKENLVPILCSGSSDVNEAWKHYQDEDRSFMICDVADMVQKFKNWRREMPRVDPFFAVKANPDPAVLQILASLGIGFDCASKVEIELVLGLGVDPSRIIYANTCKSPSSLRYAAEIGVRLLTFDNKEELYKIKDHHPGSQLVIRIKADERHASHGLAKKFGCGLEDVPRLAQVAKELDLEIVGVSFHIGINNDNPQVFESTIATCKKVFEIAKVNGHRMRLLDIGGGFPGAKDLALNFLKVSSIVRKALAEHFPMKSGVEIIAEPGKFFVDSAFTLYTQIIGKRERGEHTMYFLNDGTYGSFHFGLSHGYVCYPRPLMDVSDRPVRPSSLWGPTCDSADMILEECQLPDMHIGEWISFSDMGAYSRAAATTFNGFQKAALKYDLPPQLKFYFRKGCTWVELCNKLRELITDE